MNGRTDGIQRTLFRKRGSKNLAIWLADSLGPGRAPVHTKSKLCIQCIPWWFYTTTKSKIKIDQVDLEIFKFEKSSDLIGRERFKKQIKRSDWSYKRSDWDSFQRDGWACSTAPYLLSFLGRDLSCSCGYHTIEFNSVSDSILDSCWPIRCSHLWVVVIIRSSSSQFIEHLDRGLWSETKRSQRGMCG